MKKFLSLLLAMTMVMSLIVLPARAEENDEFKITAKTGSGDSEKTNVTVVAKNTQVTFTASSSSEEETSAGTYAWTINNTTQQGQTTKTLSYRFDNAGSFEVKCTYTPSGEAETSKIASTTITVYDAQSSVSKVTFNSRPYDVSNKAATVYYDKSTESDFSKATWDVIFSNDDYDLANVENKLVYNNKKLTAKVQYKDTPAEDVEIDITAILLAAPSITAPSANAQYAEKQEITFTANATTTSSNTKYYWSVKCGEREVANSGNQPTATWKWTAPAYSSTEANNTYTVTCALVEGAVKSAASSATTFKVIQETKRWTTDPATSTSIPVNSQKELSFTFMDYSNPASPSKVNLSAVDVTWSVTGASGSKFNTATKKGADGSASNTLTTGSISGTLNVTAQFELEGRRYTVTFPAINMITLSATLDSTYYNAGARYYTSASLVSPADSAVRSYAGAQLSVGESVSTVTINTTGYNAGYLGTFSGVSNTTITFTPTYNQFGKATFTGIATTNLGKSFAITFSIPVTPVPVNSFDSQTAEPVSTTTVNTNYKVSAPYGYTKFYVLGNSNSLTSSQTVDYSRYSATQLNSMGYAYTTIPSTYFSTSGQCTLYVIAWNDSTSYTNYSKYYCGPMTVTQTNYNINYNGVAGETVQFKHTDFTNFMNEVSQARGDSSKTSSYPYVTFSYVTFDYPSTAQGTLYYNGTAMSNSSYSGAFNSRTQITNLDNITFVPYAKTSAKNVAVTFTLHAVKYGTNGTVVNRDLPYKGTVNISLVREDIKYTVAPGDAVTFTDSAFLNYLRAQSGINFNYNIDYVTFDQSAVDTINGGVLYSGYAGYNQVKTTDKFYYTTTNNYTQNALSDVTFRASLYAKTGTTVYIPFTIYAKYGTSGAATRQVTGTVAVKIAQTMNFVDVKPTDYFYNPVKWAVGKNITKGTSAVTFSPDKTCTRAEIVTFLWRDAGSPMPTISRHPFTDVSYSMGADFYNAILWASQNGIAAGTSTTTFAPNKTCTRAEIVTFLWRYAKKPVGYGSNSFTDVNKNDHAPYYDAILWAVSKGITNGSTTTTFAPNGTCTRAQAVTFLYRYEGGK